MNVTTTLTRMTGTTQYTAKDAISDNDTTPSVFKVLDVTGKNGGAGIIRGITLVNSVNTVTAAAFNLLILRNTYTALEDNLIVDLSDAEAATTIAGVSFLSTDAQALSLNKVWTKTNLDIPFVCEAASNDLYLVLVAADAYSPASAEVFTFTFLIERPN